MLLGFHWLPNTWHTSKFLFNWLPLPTWHMKPIYLASKGNSTTLSKFWLCISRHVDLSFVVLTYFWNWCMIKLCISVPNTYFVLVGWSVTTWPGWSDPCIGCATSISSLSCPIHLSSDVFNINFSFPFFELKVGWLWPSLAYLLMCPIFRQLKQVVWLNHVLQLPLKCVLL